VSAHELEADAEDRSWAGNAELGKSEMHTGRFLVGENGGQERGWGG